MAGIGLRTRRDGEPSLLARANTWRRHPLATLHRAWLRAGWRVTLALPRHVRRNVVTRSQWGAARPRRRYGARGPLRTVVIHHTSRRNLSVVDMAAETAYMREIQQSHFDRGFVDLGYHFVIMPSGRVYLGRPVTATGAHVAGHNVGAVGIALAGNFDADQPTAEAQRSLERLLARFGTRRFGGRRQPVVVGHGDLDPHASCPGRHLRPVFTTPASAVMVKELGRAPERGSGRGL